MTIAQSHLAVETITYHATQGWSVCPLPQLDSEYTLVVVFGAARFLDHHAPIAELRAQYPMAKFIGCSTAGEIHGQELDDESLSVAICRFEHTSLATATASITQSSDSFLAGETIGRKLARPNLKAVFVLSDGLCVNGTGLVNGLNSVLSESVVITGGLAADGDRFKETWTLCENMPESHTVSAVGFYGEHVRVGHGSKGGWDVFGPERVVTRSNENILYELDGQPVLPLYKEYLGDRAKELPASALLFPLSIWNDHDDDSKLVRTILSVDEPHQALVFAGSIPQGSYAQLMRANFDHLVEGAAESAAMARIDGKLDNPTLALAISCVGRRLVLGERTEEELESALEALGSAAKQIGFYSYGEISPNLSGPSTLHNQTMTVTTISEW